MGLAWRVAVRSLRSRKRRVGTSLRKVRERVMFAWIRKHFYEPISRPKWHSFWHTSANPPRKS